MLKEVNEKMVSPRARSGQLALARALGLSQRQACELLAISRSALSCELRLSAKDTLVIEAVKTLSAWYPRYGYQQDVLARIADYPINRIDELLPWNFARPVQERRAA